MADFHRGPGLHGRREECATLDRLLESVRGDRSAVLVLRGEAGAGKSALLDYLAAGASGCRLARATGVESEMELAFASVHQLCAPMLDRLPRLPGPQREALGTAFGLGAGQTPDLFLVGLAVLGLLSDAASERPLVCVIDDAQWLDRASARILAFVARRLLAESVALVFAVRDPDDDLALTGLPEMTIGGLSDSDARALLDAAIPGRLDASVRDRIVFETRGNPLALLELPRALSPAELAGGFVRPDARPTATRIEQSFLRRVQSLPADTQRLLLTAAAEPVGDTLLLKGAVERLGIGLDAATPAEEAGLIDIGARVRFRHPLVRSAAYRAADAHDRQEVHRALAEVTDPETDPDRRAWHRAHAATHPDQEVADELERSAGRARARGGAAAAAAFLERATQLTPESARRTLRALAAAQAKFEAAAPDAARELIAIAELGSPDALECARMARLRARIVFAQRRGGDAPRLLLDAARRLAALGDVSARETYLEALAAAISAGRLAGGPDVRAVAEAAREAPAAPQPPRSLDMLLDGVAARLTGGLASGVAALQRAVQAFRGDELRTQDETMRWLRLAPIAQEAAVHQLWDYDAWDEMAVRAVHLARESGALGVLPVALMYLAGVQLHAGDLAAAAALIEEADSITSATRYAPVAYASLVLTAWRGDETSALTLMAASVRDATARGEGAVLGLAGHVTAVLYNGLGRYDAALAGAQRACDHEDLSFYNWSLVELIEAAARTGAREVAERALRPLEANCQAAGTDWALGMLARSRALLADGTAADALYLEAIERLSRGRMAVHLARARLLYGEWLRREGRRVDAREQLRVAHEMLDGSGVQAFAERARRELLATGETVRKRVVDTRDVLTAQEAQVARLAAQGRTNPEIGSQLFISPRTAEYHLHKVFAKLGIRSRRGLRDALRDAAQVLA